MEFASVLRELWRRRRLVAFGIPIAALLATLSLYRFEGLNLRARSLQHSTASTQVLVDTPPSVLRDVSSPLEPLISQASLYASLMASPAVIDLAAQRLGLRGDQIYATEPLDPRLPRTAQEPTPLKRTYEVAGENAPYRLTFTSELSLLSPGSASQAPTIGIAAQAPTTSQAIALANATVSGLQRYVAHIEELQAVRPAARVTIRQLGRASGAVANAGIGPTLAALVFALAFVLWCVAVLVGSRFRDHWRGSGASDRGRGEGSGRIVTSDGSATSGGYATS